MHSYANPPSSLQYPIGTFKVPAPSPESRLQAILAIDELPKHLAAALASLTSTQIDTPYRDGGWTPRQLAHHVADSHLNAYTRLRLALTEDWPTIKPYNQVLWAELADARSLPVEHSLAILTPLHIRWTALLDSLEEADWQRGYLHPENGRTTVEEMTELYSWHGRHHTAHVLGVRDRLG